MFIETFEVRNRLCSNRILIHISSAPVGSTVAKTGTQVEVKAVIKLTWFTGEINLETIR